MLTGLGMVWYGMDTVYMTVFLKPVLGPFNIELPN